MNFVSNKSQNRKTPFKIIGYVILAALFMSAIFYFNNYSHSSNQNPEETNTQNNIEKEAGATLPSVTQTSATPSKTPEKINSFQLPVLMYHYIRDWNKPDDAVGTNLSVSPNEFDTQMQWLANNNYQTVDFDYFSYPYKMDQKPIIVSFDDGYQDAYTDAYPVLKKYKLMGVFYIIISKVGTSGYLDWDMIKEMQKNGMKFGSHTVGHPDLRNLSDEALTNEIKNSKETLEQELQTNITDFCYPSGKYDDATISKLKEIGYKTAVTVENGTASEKTDLFEIPRKRIQNSTSLADILP